jgi:hypothetical protein
MGRSKTVAWGTVGGLLAGSAFALLAVASWPATPEVTSGQEAADLFVEAWERSLESSYFVASDFRRETGEGELAGLRAQRPPDVIRRQLGALDGRIGDHPIVCSRDPDDQVQCTRGSTELAPYEETVADEVARWDNYFDEDLPIYRVETQGDGCFDLILSLLIPVPPYGERARFCFDAATGAPVYTEIRRGDSVETLEMVELRPVTDADFALPG